MNEVDVVHFGGYCGRCEVILGMNLLPPSPALILYTTLRRSREIETIINC